MLRGIANLRKLPIGIQGRRLRLRSSWGLVGFCGALLSLDLFFIAIFSLETIYGLEQGHSWRLGPQWRIGSDWSYAEVFGYLKTGFIAFVLLLVPGKRRRPIYLAMMMIFVIALLDDALQLHEGMGSRLIVALSPLSIADWISHYVGELILWTALGVPLVVGAYAAFVRSPPEDRANAILLMGAFAVLVLFAVVVDLINELVANQLKFPGGGILFTVIEEGGEQVTLSLMCALALLIQREVRSREPFVKSSTYHSVEPFGR